MRWWGKLDAPSRWALTKRNILLLIRGAGAPRCGAVARLDATFRAIRGIGEGGFWKRTENEVAETEGTEGDSIQ